jgi:hypothetical protein
MKRILGPLVAGMVVAGVLATVVLAVRADDEGHAFKANLSGFEEIPTLFSPASGTFRAKLVDGDHLDYELTYSGFTTAVLFAHIHLGRPAVAGGVMAFLCGGGGKPSCPQGSGTVTGTIAVGDIIGPSGQGVSPGQFDRFVAAMQSGAAYVNVHSSTFPTGEIRGQIQA